MNNLIYKITSPEGKVYIGQSGNLELRIKKYKCWGCKKQSRLYFSLVKHGFDAHVIDIVEYCEREQMNERERYWQDFYDVTSEMGLNVILTPTKEKPGKIPEYVKDLISVANSGKGNGMYGKKITESAKQKQRDKLSGEQNYLSKWLLNTQTGIYYPCLREAGDSIGMDKRILWAKIIKNKKNKTPFIFV